LTVESSRSSVTQITENTSQMLQYGKQKKVTWHDSLTHHS
jgi:hypothetical protein